MSADGEDTLVSLARQLLLALEPLERGFSDADSFRALLYNLGLEATGLPAPYVDAAAEVAASVAVVEQMAQGPFELSQVGALLGHAVKIYGDLDPLPALPPGLDPATSLEILGKNLTDLLLTRYLSREWPQIYALLRATQVIISESRGDSATERAHVRTVLRWEELPKLLRDPDLIIQRVYGWGTDTLDLSLISDHLTMFLRGLGIPAQIITPDDSLVGAYAGQPFGFMGDGSRGVKVPIYFTSVAGVPVELSFQILPLPAQDSHKPGLVIQPGIPSVMPFAFALGPQTRLEITAGSDIAQQFGVLIRPDGLSVKYPFMDATTIPGVTFGVAIGVKPADPTILFGKGGGVRLQAKGFKAGIGITGPVNDLEVKLALDVHELSLVLAAADADGFLHTLLGDGETKIDVPLGVDWSSKHGFGFRGSMNFEVALHPHLQLGPIEIPDLTLSLGVPPGPEPKARLEVGLTLNGALGPLKVAVEEMGLGLYARFTPGNAGPLDLSLGFKPPKGVGLSLDAGAVRGGGYLYFDFDRGEYAGILQLNVMDLVAITAIGLITTKNPDGSPGFSLLVIITVQFTPGIQLGMGFTLIGLGGLLGLNRTMLPEPLMNGVRTGTANSIMFPEGDIIANAPRILSDLRTIFPPYQGKFLIGPMAKLGWGTPTLISVSVGVIIEIPGNIALIGVLRMNLPTADAPVLVLQVAFAGALEFDKQRLFFFASLYESRLLFMTLEGEMGLLLGWGPDAAFLFSVGGFHPRFAPPPLPFPSPARLALAILDEPNAMVRVQAYFAVTSNTAQFGAAVELRFGFDSFGISGHLGFDALFQFSPFHFIVTANVSLSLKAAGLDLLSVRVDLSLEGPTPWHAHGTGHVSLLFFEISADFDTTWGDGADTTLPPLAIRPLLRAELDKRENWSAARPAGANLLVTLRGLDEGADDLVLHPLGTLRFSQRLLPLDLTLDKLGNQRPSDARRFAISVASPQLEAKGDARERFALAQYQDMDDATKLSRPSFEQAKGGLELGSSGATLKADHMALRVVRYEEIIVDGEYKRHQALGTQNGALFTHQLNGAAIAKSRFSQARGSKLDPFQGDKVKVGGEPHTLVDSDTNRPVAGDFATEAEAREHLGRLVAADRKLAGRLQVIPAFEAAA